MQRKHTFLSFASLLALCVLLLGAIFVFQTRPTHAHASGSLPTGLHVVGNHIEDGNGSIIVPHGVDRMGTEYQCTKSGTTNFDGPVDQNSVNAMLSWDVNIVRVPLNEDCWLGINGFPANGTSAAQYQSDIENWVNLLNQNNMIVILDLHWNAPGSQQATGQEPMPDLDHAPAFWTSVANVFQNNSSVIFDLYNEPYTSSWSCWLNGSTSANASPCNDVGFAVAGMQNLVNTVRATGASNILMLGGLAYSNDLSGWLANKPGDSDNNLVASAHIYNFNVCNSTSCWNSEIAPVNAQVPVLVGEIGENDCASGFINGLMSWLDGQNIGYLAWTWTATGNCSGTPALISDYSGTPTNYGQGYEAHLQSLAQSSGGSNPTPTPTPQPPTPTPQSGGSCSIAYSIQNQWNTGFTGSVTLNNTSSNTINGWTLTFTFTDGQQVTQGWDGTWTQQGSTVTVTNASYNGTINARGSINIGFNASYNGANDTPTSFTLNNQACSVS